MSLFSRLFRKAPSPVSPETTPEKAEAPPPGRPAPDRVLVAAREEAALQAAIDAQDARAVARMVVEGSSTKVRQAAAQAVEDLVVLRQLIRDVRGGNDKSVYRILTSKRDALLEQARKAQALQADINAVLASLERHSYRHHDPLYSPTLDQLEGRWKAVAGDAAPEVVAKARVAIDRAREVIAQHLRQIAVEASRQLAAANAAVEAERQREIASKVAAEASAEQAAILDAQRKVDAEQHKAEAEKREADALALRQIGGLIRKAQGALRDGSTGRAAGVRRAVEEKLANSPPLPGYLASQLQQLDARLNELKDWKSFSVAPKRTELMEEMESLIGAELDPPVLADRIKDLQQQWRTLSKGAGEHLEEEWQRFHDAAQKAYEPCREYFAAQSAVRQENLHHREALLERLATFEAGHDWEQPDWRMVMTALRESKQEWRRYSQVERAAGRQSQERFNTVTARLQGRLDAEYDSNIAKKQSLVEQTLRLTTSEDVRQAIDSVKELQQQWKRVGPVPRDTDQKLWEEFRQHCDAIFQKRQHEFAEYTAGLETNKTQAVTLCEDLERIAALPGPQLLDSARTSVPEVRAAFEAIGEFPRGDARALRGRFERAIERCERAVELQYARDAQQSWVDLFDAANQVRALRLAGVRGVESSELDAMRQAVENHIANVAHWPKGGLEAIKRELANPGSDDVIANESALRMLCIRAEVLTDTPTPAEDQTLRRQYQVERLMQSMGQGVTADASHLNSLTLEWIRVGPTEEAAYLQLADRFKLCRERGLQRPSDAHVRD
jgi:hypothetical protein